jgi:hypothetical protein
VIANMGNISSTGPVTVSFFKGPSDSPDPQLIAQSVLSETLWGCAAQAETDVLWPGLDVGAHPFHIRVEGAEDDPPDNNTADGLVLVSGYRSFLPTVFKVR